MAGIKKAAGKASNAKQVAAAVKAVGNKLSKSEAQKLQNAGFSSKQINNISGQVNKVSSGAQKVIAAPSGGGGGGTVKQAVQQVGNTLSKGEAKDLKQDGYSVKQIGKVANRVDTVKPGAAKKIDRWQDKAAAAKEKAQQVSRHAPSTRSAVAGRAIDDLLGGGGSSAAAAAGGGGGGSAQGPVEEAPTADQNGWLAAELAAADNFEGDLEPYLFNNYRPASLDGKLRDAVAEANSFIDSHRASWDSSDRLMPSLSSVTSPRSLLEDDEQARWGL